MYFKGKCYNRYDRKNIKWFLFIHILKWDQTGMHFSGEKKFEKSLSFYSNTFLNMTKQQTKKLSMNNHLNGNCWEFIWWNYNYFTDK